MSKRPNLKKTLYGACYYNEYHPIERLDQDFADMNDANLTVLRVGESVWSTWEPRDGEFNLEWLQPILDKAASQGISVIIGMPTYAIPSWLRLKHPEIMADRKTGQPIHFGHRQNMDYSNPIFIKYADRIIQAIVQRYKDHPAVIGWQVDNEPGVELLHNPGVFDNFKAELKEKFKTVDYLNKIWGLVYWSHGINDWEELWIPDGNTNNGYDLEWRRYQARITDRYINWQADKLSKLVPNDHFILTCVALDRPAQDIYTVADNLDVIGANIYYPTQDGLLHPYSKYAHNREISGPAWMTFAGPSVVFRQADLSYSMKQDNFLVTETTATSTVHVNTSGLFPPYPGQLKQVALAMVSRGANMVEYWHWHTLHYGAENYWGGILGHNYERGRTYESFQEIANFFKKQEDFLQDLRPSSPVAILYSPESKWAMEFQPVLRKTVNGLHVGDPDSYNRIFNAFYEIFFDSQLGVNVYGPSQLTDPAKFLKKHPVLCVPAYFVSDDLILDFMNKYSQLGGHLILGPRTGYGNINGTIRVDVPPKIIRQASKTTYNETSNLNKPVQVISNSNIGISGDAFGWADLIVSEGAETLANYEDPFLSKYQAITTALNGSGRVTTIGTVPSQVLGKSIGNWVRNTISISSIINCQSDSFTTNSAITKDNKVLHFLFNWGWETVEADITNDCINIENGEKILNAEKISLGPWDVKILMEI